MARETKPPPLTVDGALELIESHYARPAARDSAGEVFRLDQLMRTLYDQLPADNWLDLAKQLGLSRGYVKSFVRLQDRIRQRIENERKCRIAKPAA